MDWTTPQARRLAGFSTIGALVALVLSGIALWLFFGGAGDVYGPINDVLVSVTCVLLVPPILATEAQVRGSIGGWFQALTLLALAGLALAAFGQLLLVAGILSLDGSYVTGGLGILPFLAWCVAVMAIALRGQTAVPRRLGWLLATWLVLVIVLSVVTAVGSDAAIAVTAVALVVAIAAWLLAVARDLLGNAGMRTASSALP